MSEATKARVVGFNHVALEVGDIEAALAFYGRLFDFKLRSKRDDMNRRLRLAPPKQTLPQISGRRMRPISWPCGVHTVTPL